MLDYLASILTRVFVRMFSPRPTIHKEGGLLVVESGWRTALLTLGSRHRRLVIDPKARTIKLTDRRLWFLNKSRRLEFDWIHRVFYTYSDLLDIGYLSHFQQDLFCVGLELHDQSRVTLFKFFGEGDFVNESIWPDWTKWDEFTIAKIAQHNLDSESSQLVDVLCALLGVDLTNDPG